jgi:predicted cupin superfamily sugar epimerase
LLCEHHAITKASCNLQAHCQKVVIEERNTNCYSKTTTIITMLPTKRSEVVHVLGLVPHPEGGYFHETHRSGSVHMSSRGVTDTHVEEKDLVKTSSGASRNALTSIYWVPTIEFPKLRLGVNQSDHVNYYQGGRPFEYFLYDPAECGKLQHFVLGPDICNGQKLQLAVKGGVWKCGHMLTINAATTDEGVYEFSMIGDAAGPGFDMEDFSFVTADMLERECPLHIQRVLTAYVNEKNLSLEDKNQDFDEYYGEAEDSSFSPSQNRRLFQLTHEPLC